MVATAATIHDGSQTSARLEAVFAEEFASACEGTVTARQAVTPGIEDFGEVNSGSPQTLAWFIKTAIKMFPAKKYGLSLWDHGGGWQGYGNDDSAGGGMSIADVVSGVGYDHAVGPFHDIHRVVTNLAVLDFNTPDHSMRVLSVTANGSSSSPGGFRRKSRFGPPLGNHPLLSLA